MHTTNTGRCFWKILNFLVTIFLIFIPTNLFTGQWIWKKNQGSAKFCANREATGIKCIQYFKCKAQYVDHMTHQKMTMLPGVTTKSCGADCMCMCASLVLMELVVTSLSALNVECKYIVLHCKITFHYLTITNEACVK